MPPFDSSAFLKTVPGAPGVYRMYGDKSQVIYVGKAKDLKKRLASYFRSNVDSIKTRALVANIAFVEFTVTNSETEALILENNLIKQYMPKYNVLLRDDKSFPYILLTDHKHPRITAHRGPKKVPGQYFGPYPSAGAVWESLKLLQKVIPVRQCEDGFYRARTRPCLQYQLKLCSAPCVGKISDEAYAAQVRLTRLFLQGKNQQVIDDLVQQMEAASNQLDFELAAQLRDQIIALRKVQEQQAVSGDHEEMDILGFCYLHGVAAVHVLYVRDQKILGTKTYFPKLPQQTDAEEIFPAFLLQFYLNNMGGQQIPREIVIGETLEDADSIAEAISAAAGRKVVLNAAKRGEKARYLDLANKNARTACDTKVSQAAHMAARYRALKQVLKLELLQRMECFDISHTMGNQTMASCVVFNDKGPDKAEYRRFHVEGVTPGDDYAAMRFALKKRYGKLSDEARVPDIVLIDGGAGQLSQAIEFFTDWPLAKMPLLLGVAKGTSRKPGLETLLINSIHHAINLPADDPALHLIQHIRDEAHRFAITGHRQQRGKKFTQSPLENIAGIGEKRRQALLQYLGGLQGVLKASVAELATVPGISKAQAELIYQACHNN
ncbi:excinuclease ABC subunit UvrC [Rheinheimera texasensis]|uniref:excinuclease ABC subunit UvrC n=1 Tax=Rheinheimera texasensis TaxID=306205 RepID=UPI0004E1572C|nr:excinuclease ABC subunit UvrC [Rheinheimera texasensis]